MSDAMAGQPGASFVRALIVVAGRVQGVGYRAFTVRIASGRGLCGTVRNLDDGRVEIEVEGRKEEILSLVADLKKGPPAAVVSTASVEWSEATGRFNSFHIRY
jgi:acylphosphatase